MVRRADGGPPRTSAQVRRHRRYFRAVIDHAPLTPTEPGSCADGASHPGPRRRGPVSGLAHSASSRRTGLRKRRAPGAYFQCAATKEAQRGEHTRPSPDIRRCFRSFLPHPWHSSWPGSPPVAQDRKPRTTWCSVTLEFQRPTAPPPLMGRFTTPLNDALWSHPCPTSRGQFTVLRSGLSPERPIDYRGSLGYPRGVTLLHTA